MKLFRCLIKGNAGEWTVVTGSITIITGVLYGQIVDNYFLNDDFGRLLCTIDYQNRGIWTLFVSQGCNSLYYRPVTDLWLLLINNKAGLDPQWYYLSSILLHVFSSITIYWITKKLISSSRATTIYWAPLIAAWIFAIHPRHVESIALIHDIENIICGFFYFLGLFFFILYCKSDKIGYLCLAALSYLASLFGKEMGVTLPLICLSYYLIFCFPIRNILSLWRDRTAQLSFFLFGGVFLIYLIMRYYALETIVGGAGPTSELNFSTIRMIKVAIQSIAAMIIPNDLPGLKTLHQFFQVNITLFILSAMAIGTIVLWKLRNVKSPIFWFGIAWSIISLLPILNNGISVHELTGGRYLYPVLGGFALSTTVLLGQIQYKPLFILAASMVLIIFSLCTYHNNSMMTVVSGISEKFLKGMGSVMQQVSGEKVVVLVPGFYKGLYMIPGAFRPGMLLVYGQRAKEFLEHTDLTELVLLIKKPGTVNVNITNNTKTQINISLPNSVSFLQGNDFKVGENVKFDNTRIINNWGLIAAQKAQLNKPIHAVIIPDLSMRDSKHMIIHRTENIKDHTPYINSLRNQK